MTNDVTSRIRDSEGLDAFLRRLLDVALDRDDIPEEDTPLGKLAP